MYPNEFISNLFSTNKNFEDYARIEKDNKREKNLVRNIELNRCSIKFSGGQAAEREKFGEPRDLILWTEAKRWRVFSPILSRISPVIADTLSAGFARN